MKIGSPFCLKFTLCTVKGDRVMIGFKMFK